MSAKIVPLNKDTHKDLKVKLSGTYDQAKDQHMSLLVVHEFSKAATEYPIIFVKDPESGRFRAVCLFGLEPKENLFYSKTKWKGIYVPANLRAYPFVLGGSADSEQLTLCVDEGSKLVGNKDGEPLFADGEETEFLNARKQFLGQLIEQGHVTQAFIDFLAEKELLTPQSLQLNFEGEEKGHDLTGMYVVSEQKLNELSDEDFLELRKRGYLGPIYAHLASLNQIHNLGQLKVAANKRKKSA